jgi:hypothetical protein
MNDNAYMVEAEHTVLWSLRQEYKLSGFTLEQVVTHTFK